MRALATPFLTAGIAIGAVQAWLARYCMGSDGISYLDLADALRAGDWATFINPYWSPLYPALLAATQTLGASLPVAEPVLVHVANLLIFAAALAAAALFIDALSAPQSRARQQAVAGSAPTDRDTWRAPPRDKIPLLWIACTLAATLWSFLRVSTIDDVTPDMLVNVFFMAACAILLRIYRDPTEPANPAALGVVLGLGYLAKAAMLPIGIVFLTVAARKLRRNAMAAMIAPFAIICAIWIACLSIDLGRFTWGEAGRLNYIWMVNGEPNVHGQSGDHPTRRIHGEPPVHEFTEPIAATYAPWLDPVYWGEGVEPSFDTRQQLHRIAASFRIYLSAFGRRIGPLWLLLILVGWLSRPDPQRRSRIQQMLPVLIPSASVFILYAPIWVEPRFFGGPVAVATIALIYIVWDGQNERSRGRTAAFVAATAGLATLFLAGGIRQHQRQLARSECNTEPLTVSQSLRESGLAPGDPVGFIGLGDNQYWARLAGLRIVTDVGINYGTAQERSTDFWSYPPDNQRTAIDAMQAQGVRAIVARRPPPTRADALGFHPLLESDYSVLLTSNQPR